MISRVIALHTLGCAFVLSFAQGAAAQDHTHDQPAWISDVGVAGANIVAGGLTAAATAAIRGNDVAEAFLKGAVGGGLLFAGKRVAVERFSGAGILGRQVASVGSSVVVNGGCGRAWLSEVWLPLGPVSFQVRPATRWRGRLNLRDVGTLVWAATRRELDFDLARSVSNGAPAFVAQKHRLVSGRDHAAGLTIGGVVLLGATNLDIAVTQSHENVHVIQNDYLLQTVSRPLEQWGWGWITDRDIPLDFNLLPFLTPPLLHDIEEREAQVLEFR